MYVTIDFYLLAIARDSLKFVVMIQYFVLKVGIIFNAENFDNFEDLAQDARLAPKCVSFSSLLNLKLCCFYYPEV